MSTTTIYPSKRKMKQAFRDGHGVYEDGQSSWSVNCQAARARGRLPMTDATKRVSELCNLAGRSTSRKEIRAALVASHDGEWHHTSKYGNRTNYYDPMAALQAMGVRLAL